MLCRQPHVRQVFKKPNPIVALYNGSSTNSIVMRTGLSARNKTPSVVPPV